MKIELGEKRESDFGGWGRWVTIDDEGRYWIGVEKGKRVLRPFISKKAVRQGAKKYGFHWFGYVRDHLGRELYRTRVPKDVSAKAIIDYWLGNV